MIHLTPRYVNETVVTVNGLVLLYPIISKSTFLPLDRL